MATSRSEVTSDEIVNIKCCVCVEENRTREAEKYCIECNDYFCLSCVGIHRKISSMKGHKLLEKSDFKSLGPDGSLPSYPTERCGQHQLKVVDLYCKDHDAVACASCIALSHRSCKSIVSIPDEIDHLYQGINLTETKQAISKMKKSMEEIKSAKETKIKALEVALNTEMESVKAFRKELQALIDKMEQETIQELRKKFRRIEDSLTEDINEVENLMSSLNEVILQLKKSEGNKSQEFVCVKSSNKATAKGKEVEKRQKMAADETVSFTPDHSIKVSLQQVKAFGKVSVNKQEHLTETSTPKDSLYTVKQTREIDVKLENDKNICDIRGSCFTEDGFLLLVDDNNNKLKLVDMFTEKVKDYIVLKSQPWTVCTVSRNEAAVQMDNTMVQFVSLGEKMTVTRMLTFNHACYGLAHNHGKLFTSDYCTLYIYDINGQELNRISLDRICIGLTPENRHIVISDNRDLVFVTNSKNCVIILNSKGTYHSTLSDNKVIGYRGVCTDGRNIFVFGETSKNIVQFGHDFKMLGEVEKVDGAPLSLCFYPHKMNLIVTLSFKNKITILELE